MKLFAELPEGKIYHGDAYNLLSEIEPNSVDLIITDPPYPKEFLFCWDILGLLGKRLLKRSGSLIALGGEYYLPYIIRTLSNQLKYHYIIGYRVGSQHNRIYPKKIYAEMKVMLWFVKESYTGHWLGNFIENQTAWGSIKKHKWQQPSDFCHMFIYYMVERGGIVLDPFCGSGTVGVVSKELGRQFILCDIEEESCEISYQRVIEAKANLIQTKLLM